MTRSDSLLFAIHFIGNALILWLAYYWLGVGESNIARLTWSALLALVVVCAFVWLHGASFAYFRFGRTGLPQALTAAARHLLPLFLLGIATLIIYGMLSWWRGYSSHVAFTIASWLTLKTRHPFKPATILAIFSTALWIVRWLVLPVLLLPLAAGLATKGWHGFRGESHGMRRRWLYWVEVVGLLFVGIWVPIWLVLAWVPLFHHFSVEVVSFLIRLTIGYLMFVTALLFLEFFTSGGSPRTNQVNTVSAP